MVVMTGRQRRVRGGTLTGVVLATCDWGADGAGYAGAGLSTLAGAVLPACAWRSGAREAGAGGPGPCAAAGRRTRASRAPNGGSGVPSPVRYRSDKILLARPAKRGGEPGAILGATHPLLKAAPLPMREQDLSDLAADWGIVDRLIGKTVWAEPAHRTGART